MMTMDEHEPALSLPTITAGRVVLVVSAFLIASTAAVALALRHFFKDFD